MSFDDTAPFARRSFIGTVAAGTIALASSPLSSLSAESIAAQGDPWLQALKGKHKAVFDGAELNAGFPLMFAATYLSTMTEHYKLGAGDISHGCLYAEIETYVSHAFPPDRGSPRLLGPNPSLAAPKGSNKVIADSHAAAARIAAYRTKLTPVVLMTVLDRRHVSPSILPYPRSAARRTHV